MGQVDEPKESCRGTETRVAPRRMHVDASRGVLLTKRCSFCFLCCVRALCFILFHFLGGGAGGGGLRCLSLSFISSLSLFSKPQVGLPKVLLSTPFFRLATNTINVRNKNNNNNNEVLSFQPLIPPKRFAFSPQTGGCSEGLDSFRFFSKQQQHFALFVDLSLLRNVR